MEITSQRNEIERILSLVGTPKQAIHRQPIDAIRASMIPRIESKKSIGLVQLPGMMIGQIVWGADPIQAVQCQILIIFTLLTNSHTIEQTLFNIRMQILKSQ